MKEEGSIEDTARPIFKMKSLRFSREQQQIFKKQRTELGIVSPK